MIDWNRPMHVVWMPSGDVRACICPSQFNHNWDLWLLLLHQQDEGGEEAESSP